MKTTTPGSAAFDQQVERLLDLGYARAAGLTPRAFRRLLAPLRAQAEVRTTAPCDPEGGRLPLVIVLPRGLVSATWAMTRIVRLGRRGHEAMQPVTPDQFAPIPLVRLPPGQPYLLVDIERGADTLNVRPEDALVRIRRRRRSPLTLEEGIAVLTHYPDFLQKNNCFSLLASRRADQRVPALWIDGARRPKLGWCWDRNPHTWLGSASCRCRVTAA